MGKFSGYIIGIDEAGRGPLAGHVVVAGIKISVKRKTKSEKLLWGIKDSKKLTPQKREEWFFILTKHPKIEWAVARVSPKVIDRINISKAANLAARRVYKKLSSGGKRIIPALLDGGLHLSKNAPFKTIIKGDEKIPVIGAASIIAKVTRDRLMLRLHKKHPQYGFNIHKGYPTRKHKEMIRKFGLSPVHRRTFKIR